MPSHKNVHTFGSRVGYEAPGKPTELRLQGHFMGDARSPAEAEDILLQSAAWRMRSSKKEARMYRLRCAGELAMVMTVAPLGIWGVAQAVMGRGIEPAGISAVAIVWSSLVGRAVVGDFRSQEYTNLVNNAAQQRMSYEAMKASREVTPDQI